MVAITVAIASVVYIYANNLVSSTVGTQVTPMVSFQKGTDTLTVITADNNIAWSSVTVTGGTAPTTGNIQAGDKITDCTGDVAVIIDNTLVGTWTFD